MTKKDTIKIFRDNCRLFAQGRASIGQFREAMDRVATPLSQIDPLAEREELAQYCCPLELVMVLWKVGKTYAYGIY